MITTFNYFYKASLILILLITVSCESKVQVNIDGQESQLTVDAFLNNLRQTQKVRLTFTDSYFSGKTPPPLSGAIVILTDMSLNREFSFHDQHNGDYTYDVMPFDTMIMKGHTYQLTVQFDRYEYKAVTVCRRTSIIDSLFFNFQEATTGLVGATKAGHMLTLISRDEQGSLPDFYWLKLFKNGKFKSRLQDLQLETFGNNNEGDGQFFMPQRWNVSDGTMGDSCVSGDKVRLEIHGISRETYDFLSLGKQMSNNGGLFAVTPVNQATNIYPTEKQFPKAVGQFHVGEATFKETVLK
jgi:hypothetical protein